MLYINIVLIDKYVHIMLVIMYMYSHVTYLNAKTSQYMNQLIICQKNIKFSFLFLVFAKEKILIFNSFFMIFAGVNIHFKDNKYILTSFSRFQSL